MKQSRPERAKVPGAVGWIWEKHAGKRATHTPGEMLTVTRVGGGIEGLIAKCSGQGLICSRSSCKW